MIDAILTQVCEQFEVRLLHAMLGIDENECASESVRDMLSAWEAPIAITDEAELDKGGRAEREVRKVYGIDRVVHTASCP